MSCNLSFEVAIYCYNNNNNEIINELLNKSNDNIYEHLSLQNHISNCSTFNAHLGNRELTGMFLVEEFPTHFFLFDIELGETYSPLCTHQAC